MVQWCSWCITLTQARIRRNVENTWSKLCFLLSLFIYSQLKQKLFQPLMPSFTIVHGTYQAQVWLKMSWPWLVYSAIRMSCTTLVAHGAVISWELLLGPGRCRRGAGIYPGPWEEAGGSLACTLGPGRRLEGGWHVPWALEGGWREAGQPVPFRPADAWGI